jgi:hypothetical protein
MKSIIKPLPYLAAGLFFLMYLVLTKKFNRLYVLLLLLAVAGSGCFFKYYRTGTTNKIDAQTIQNLQEAKKNFILHTPNGAFLMDSVRINNDIMRAGLSNVPTNYEIYLNPNQDKANRFKNEDRAEVLAEVHLFTHHQPDSGTQAVLNIHDFYRMDVYTFDKKATTKSTIGSIFIMLGAVAVAVGIFTFLTECNCPQVYACQGDQCQFKGGLYSGAISKSLERTDYMPLSNPMLSGNKIQLKILSVDEEEQVINQVGLLQVDHAVGTHVLLDRHGIPFVYGQPLAPESVVAGKEKDIMQAVSVADGHNYSFTNNAGDGQSSDIMLDFKKPIGASSGRLILRAKNSAWSGYLMRDFKALFGNQFTAWTAKKDMADPQEMVKWQLEQSLPMIVSVKKGKDWNYLDYFSTPGNTAPRDMIMNLDLSEFVNEDHVRVRLQTAFMFWDLDYAGMDFSQPAEYQSAFLSAKKMMKSDGRSQEHLLQGKDALYTHMLPKEDLELEFEVQSPKQSNDESSYFLVGGGYYHYQKNYEGKPNMSELSAFLKEGAFDHFSRKKFEEWQNLINNNSVGDLSYRK